MPLDRAVRPQIILKEPVVTDSGQHRGTVAALDDARSPAGRRPHEGGAVSAQGGAPRLPRRTTRADDGSARACNDRAFAIASGSGSAGTVETGAAPTATCPARPS